MNAFARLVLLVLAFCSAGADAADATSVGIRPTTPTTTLQGNTDSDRAVRALTQAELGAMWGLTPDEMARVSILSRGPRAAFSGPNISPIEILGIHARNAAERRKYAELFAKALHADTERVLVWSNEAKAAYDRLYPGEPVVSFDGVQPGQAHPSAAAAARVPMTSIKPRPAR